MLEDGEYIGVEDYDDLQRAIQLGVLYYNKCRLLNYPESTLSLLRRYIDEAKRLLDNKDVETKDNVPITGLDSEGKPILPEAPVEAPQAPVAPAPLM
jgi:hypothetical protein